MECPSRSSSASPRRHDFRGHRTLALLVPLLLAACAATEPFVAPSVIGKAPGEVSRLVAASDAGLFPCTFIQVVGDSAVPLGPKRSELSLAPGRYVISLECASGYHFFRPRAELIAQAGKSYRITGYLVDNSITIFNMRMRARVEELPS